MGQIEQSIGKVGSRDEAFNAASLMEASNPEPPLERTEIMGLAAYIVRKG